MNVANAAAWMRNGKTCMECKLVKMGDCAMGGQHSSVTEDIRIKEAILSSDAPVHGCTLSPLEIEWILLQREEHAQLSTSMTTEVARQARQFYWAIMQMCADAGFVVRPYVGITHTVEWWKRFGSKTHRIKMANAENVALGGVMSARFPLCCYGNLHSMYEVEAKTVAGYKAMRLELTDVAVPMELNDRPGGSGGCNMHRHLNWTVYCILQPQGALSQRQLALWNKIVTMLPEHPGVAQATVGPVVWTAWDNSDCFPVTRLPA